ncbi:transposase [Streptomyces sp. NPDC050145]|uniref:transposase n=1 Tax=Streptomyces sp. NPDC050145 TaxID=3365602 RepID=UPI003794B513
MSLIDAQWARIEPLFPDRTPKRGGRWRDHREVIDAIAFKFQTGTQWIHLPERYGNWCGVYNRLRMWAIDGTWERVFTVLMAQTDADEDLNWTVSVDSTIVRARQCVLHPYPELAQSCGQAQGPPEEKRPRQVRLGQPVPRRVVGYRGEPTGRRRGSALRFDCPDRRSFNAHDREKLSCDPSSSA